MGALFGGGGGSSSAPKPRPPAPMPDVNDPAIKEQEDMTRRAAMRRSGRSSTVLARPSGTGGSQAYRNSLLGQS